MSGADAFLCHLAHCIAAALERLAASAAAARAKLQSARERFSAVHCDELEARISAAETAKVAALEQELCAVDAALEQLRGERRAVAEAAASMIDAELLERHSALTARLDAVDAQLLSLPTTVIELPHVGLIVDEPSPGFAADLGAGHSIVVCSGRIVAPFATTAADLALACAPHYGEPSTTLCLSLVLQSGGHALQSVDELEMSLAAAAAGTVVAASLVCQGEAAQPLHAIVSTDIPVRAVNVSIVVPLAPATASVCVGPLTVAGRPVPGLLCETVSVEVRGYAFCGCHLHPTLAMPFMSALQSPWRAAGHQAQSWIRVFSDEPQHALASRGGRRPDPAAGSLAALAVYYFPDGSTRPVGMRFWASAASTAGDLAAFICARLSASDRPVSEPSDPPPPAGPHELLVTGATCNPCMIRMTIPHALPLREPLTAGQVRLCWGARRREVRQLLPTTRAPFLPIMMQARLRGMPPDLMICMVWHVPQAGAASLSATAIASEPITGIPAAPAVGPKLWEFVPVWLRFNKSTNSHSMADNLILSLPSLQAHSSTGLVTNRDIHDVVRRKIERFILAEKRVAFNDFVRPFCLHVIHFDHSKRGRGAEMHYVPHYFPGPPTVVLSARPSKVCWTKSSSSTTWTSLASARSCLTMSRPLHGPRGCSLRVTLTTLRSSTCTSMCTNPM